jgi:hypothetical protein
VLCLNVLEYVEDPSGGWFDLLAVGTETERGC